MLRFVKSSESALGWKSKLDTSNVSFVFLKAIQFEDMMYFNSIVLLEGLFIDSVTDFHCQSSTFLIIIFIFYAEGLDKCLDYINRLCSRNIFLQSSLSRNVG